MSEASSISARAQSKPAQIERPSPAVEEKPIQDTKRADVEISRTSLRNESPAVYDQKGRISNGPEANPNSGRSAVTVPDQNGVRNSREAPPEDPPSDRT